MTDKFASIKHICFHISVILFLSVNFACNDDPTGLGSDFIPGDNNPNVALDSITFVLGENLFKDSLIVQAVDSAIYDNVYYYSTFIDYNIIGQYKDNLVGTSTADLMFELKAPGYTTSLQGKTNSVISLKFFLEKYTQNGAANDTVVLGSKDAPLNYEIYTLNKSIPFNKKYYSTADLQQYIDSKIVSSNNRTSSQDSMDFDITDQELANHLLLNIDSINLTSDSAFNKNVLHGLYVRATYPGSSGGALYVADAMNSRLEMKVKSGADTVTLTYYVRGISRGISGYQFNRSGSASETDNEHYFVQGMGGTYLRLTFQDLDKKWPVLKPISIYKAEVILTPDSVFLTNNNVTKKDYPRLMYLYLDNKDNSIIDDAILGTSYYGGFYSSGAYRFNITKYFHRFIKENLTNSSMFLKVSNSTTNAANGLFDAGRVAFKKSGGIKLKITYSKL